ncbi:MAG: HIT domain-containing protein [Bdellovibrionales bacterium]
MSCVFCKIINKEIPSEVVYEDERVLGIKDIQPKSPTHLLFLPKTHIESLDSLDESQIDVFNNILLVAKKFATEHSLRPYRLTLNTGAPFQEVMHLHLHLESTHSMN